MADMISNYGKMGMNWILRKWAGMWIKNKTNLFLLPSHVTKKNNKRINKLDGVYVCIS